MFGISEAQWHADHAVYVAKAGKAREEYRLILAAAVEGKSDREAAVAEFNAQDAKAVWQRACDDHLRYQNTY